MADLTDVDLIRRTRNLIPDTDEIFGEFNDEYLFTDENIVDFLTDGHDVPKWAAGLAKMAIGGSEALLLKVIKNYETQTDGASLMKQWTDAGRRMIADAQTEYTASLESFEIVYIGSDVTNTDPYWWGYRGY